MLMLFFLSRNGKWITFVFHSFWKVNLTDTKEDKLVGKCWWKYIWYPPAFTKIYHLLGVWSTLSLPLPLSLSWSHHVYRDSDYISSPCLCVDNVDDDDDHEAHGEQAICLLVSLHIAIRLPLTYIVTCVIIIAAKTTSWIVFLSLTCCDFDLLTKQDMAVFSQKYPDNFGCSLIQLSSRDFYHHHWQQNRGQTDFFHLNFQLFTLYKMLCVNLGEWVVFGLV